MCIPHCDLALLPPGIQQRPEVAPKRIHVALALIRTHQGYGRLPVAAAGKFDGPRELSDLVGLRMFNPSHELVRWLVTGHHLMQAQHRIVQVMDRLLIRLQVAFVAGQQITTLSRLGILQVVQNTVCRAQHGKRILVPQAVGNNDASLIQE